MGKVKKAYELEITKILAKTMQSSYRKKQVEELVSRILLKMQAVIRPSGDCDEIEALRSEFMFLKQEAHSLMNS
ncbi:hypothetical protein [Encephalitozoon cuniculi GB-M1]|uniref:Uncharacterized protein n=1 Tax=Encephalitozoon cuniculi (strain GB-M1) TaxID=284813 RepID=Q8SUZ6_ENCCU|nr:uncharacterized protein ECU07_0970 [Encephalitozoon cuniculi GB-M1]KMV65821.1 hypothetical protein M970_070930 [Encephalitozoon cuniculi EcunIII-L]UYI27257.1 hypothetical protein J0A71_05g11160 [Encephalitozoon cuniculi]CAD25629.2 hypothetical protein [Encephalitozoon cuniculi GB-M1]